MTDDFHVDGPVCFYNIGKKQRQFRERLGYAAVGIGVAVGIILILVGVPSWWRLGLSIFFAGSVGFFQAYEKT